MYLLALDCHALRARNDVWQFNDRHCEGVSPWQSGATRRTGKHGFSLIELLIRLIIVSIIIAAFTPMLTTKLKHREIALTGSKVETECSKKFSKKCMVCTDSEYILCNNSFSCPYGQYCDEAENCICKSCSSKFSKCIKCTKNYCEICKDGYKVNSSRFCKKIKCADGTYPSGSSCLPCPEPCATCKSTTECIKCLGGYVWNGKEYVKKATKQMQRAMK